MRAWLEFKDERVSVDGSCAIGRLPENQIVLDDAQVSRRHALVQAHGSGGHWLIDFGSSNGSLLNHRRVFEPTRLNDKDEIEIAGHRLVFREKRELAQGGPAYNAAAWKATERCTQTFAATNHGAILLDEAGKIATITPQAREWLAQYFKQPKGNTLPENLRHWLERQRQVAEDHTGFPAELVISVNPQRRLVVRLAERNSPQQLLLLTEEQSVFSMELLQTLGLTVRESEVLYWLAEGKSNPEIGIILESSPRTVGKHVEHILEKLRVETRSAALLFVVEKLTRARG